MAGMQRTILGIDPGLANTGWGVVAQVGPRLSCTAYGCVSTPKGMPLAQRLRKIHEQMTAVIARYEPVCAGVETVWFGVNVQSAFATGQARGAALVACAERNLELLEFSPSQIKLAVVGAGSADKAQVQYMVRQLLQLDEEPRPDHAADALAAAICYTTHEGFEGRAAPPFASPSSAGPAASGAPLASPSPAGPEPAEPTSAGPSPAGPASAGPSPAPLPSRRRPGAPGLSSGPASGKAKRACGLGSGKDRA